MISHITLKLKDGSLEELTMEEAKELYEELEVIFGKKEDADMAKWLKELSDKASREKTTWPQPYQPFQPFRVGDTAGTPYPAPPIIYCKEPGYVS